MNAPPRVRKYLLFSVVTQVMGLLASAPLIFSVTPLRLTLFLAVGQSLLLVSVLLYVLAVIFELRSDDIL